jgi:hypothetical protein
MKKVLQISEMLFPWELYEQLKLSNSEQHSDVCIHQPD